MHCLRDWYICIEKNNTVEKVVDGKVVLEKTLMHVKGRIIGESPEPFFDEYLQKIGLADHVGSFIIITCSGKICKLKYEEASVSSLNDTAAALLQLGISEEEVGSFIILSENASLQKQRKRTGREIPEAFKSRKVEKFVKETELSFLELCLIITDEDWYFFFKNEQGEVSELIRDKYCNLEVHYTAKLLQWGIYLDLNMGIVGTWENERKICLWESKGLLSIKVNNQSAKDIFFEIGRRYKEKNSLCRKGEVTTVQAIAYK